MIIPEISAAITSARGEIFKGLISLGIDSKVQAAVIDAQNVTLQLQSQMFDILAKFEQQAAELSELREKLREKEDWNVTAAKYAPYRTVDGVVVYRLK